MEWIARHRQYVIVALAVTAPLAVAAVLVPFRDSLTNAAAALILVAVIVAIASSRLAVRGFSPVSRRPCGSTCFLTHPYNSFDIHGRDPREMTICLLVVGLGVTELAARRRHLRRVSEEESHYVAMVRELTDARPDDSGSDSIERAERDAGRSSPSARVSFRSSARRIRRWPAFWRTVRWHTWAWRGRSTRWVFPDPKPRSWPSGEVAPLADS